MISWRPGAQNVSAYWLCLSISFSLPCKRPMNGAHSSVVEALIRQDLPYEAGYEAAGGLAPPKFAVHRIPPAPQHSEHCDHYSPKDSEFVTSIRQRPYVADLKMPAQEHGHQQIHRSEQGDGACEETHSEPNRANEFDH